SLEMSAGPRSRMEVRNARSLSGELWQDHSLHMLLPWNGLHWNFGSCSRRRDGPKMHERSHEGDRATVSKLIASDASLPSRFFKENRRMASKRRDNNGV